MAAGAQVGSLGEPYGRNLVENLVPSGKIDQALQEAQEMAKVKPFVDFVYDAEKLALGAYSPLDGFMTHEQFDAVTKENRLPNGLPWTIPIVLAAPASQVLDVREGDEVALLDWGDRPFARLAVSDKYTLPKEQFAEGAYGTTDPSHPNVEDIFNSYGDTALAGKVTLVRRLDLPTVRYELSPKETRELFAAKKWRNVVAYQCRNPPHTAHEYIQKMSLEREEIDGLFVQPVIGRLKKGDYKPTVIMDAYKAVTERYYPKDRAMLSSLSITMRYAGPKAALFYAIVRKNYGATHYIVGRDQAGVGTFYEPYECHRIFDRYDVGIVPLKYLETFYCRQCSTMATPKTCPHPESDHVSTSQTRIRKILAEGGKLPMEILRPEVAEILAQGDVIIT